MLNRQLEIQVEEEKGISIVSLNGAIDPSNVEEFKRTLEPLCGKENTQVVLDCSNLSYVNSQSLGLLFYYHSLCETHQGRLAFYGVWDKIQNILRLLGLDTILFIYDSREKAVASFQTNGQDTPK